MVPPVCELQANLMPGVGGPLKTAILVPATKARTHVHEHVWI